MAGEAEREVFLPAAWVDARPGPKRWTADAPSDDPSAREIHRPTGPGIGDGKAFLFLFGYKAASEKDRWMLGEELTKIGDDIDVLRAAGYTVVLDRQATRDDLRRAVAGDGAGVEGLVPAGVYWSGHGQADGSLECCDGATVAPGDLDPSTVDPGLRLMVLGACYVGAHAPAWRAALGGHPLVAGWGRPVTLERAVEFLEASDGPDVGLDDLIQHWLLTDAPIPPTPADDGLPPAAVTAGRPGRLDRRMPALTEHLGAAYAEHDNHFDVTVPLPGGRSQVVQVFVTDGTEPFTEGMLLCGMESAVGPTSALITPGQLLARASRAGYGRVALVARGTGVPEIATQSFVPLTGTSTQQLAAHCYQVALHADGLQDALFGGDE